MPPRRRSTSSCSWCPGRDAPAIAAAAERGVIIGEGSNLTRRLANRAANDVSPEVLADEAHAIAAAHGLWIDVIDEVRAAELGMGMFLAVGRGSANPPRMIVMRSGGEGETDALGRHLALVGKGVCFDSGGISIKPAERMEEMKTDKTGACTVLAVAATLARLAPGTPLLVVAPAVENMPGPHSTRPGDVVTALNGRSVEITNTDAEGRLILGDAMTYAERLGATHVVDVATLTGAVVRALGHLVAGGFGAPQAWFDEVAAAAVRAGERLWQLPLVEDYWPEMESYHRRHVEHGLDAGRRPDPQRAVPAPLRDRAVGPPRHRRHGATSARRRRGPPRASPEPRRRPSSSSPWPGPADAWSRRRPWSSAVAGAAWGLAADRVGGALARARGQVGADEAILRPAGWVRPIDWRTPVTVVLGGLSLGAWPSVSTTRSHSRSSGPSSPR